MISFKYKGKLAFQLSEKEWRNAKDTKLINVTDREAINFISSIAHGIRVREFPVLVDTTLYQVKLNLKGLRNRPNGYLIPIVEIGAFSEKHVKAKYTNRDTTRTSFGSKTRRKVNDPQGRKKFRINNNVVTIYFYTKEEIYNIKKNKIIDFNAIIKETGYTRLIEDNKRIKADKIGIYYNQDKVMDVRITSIENNIAKVKILDETNDLNLTKASKKSLLSYDDRNRIILHKNYYNVSKLKTDKNILKEIQLIDSTSNHATIGHPVEERVVTIEYFMKEKNVYDTFDIAVHYCMKCGKYFDYYESFKLQLANKALFISEMNINIERAHLSDNYEGNLYKKLAPESVLKKHGYTVGKSGLSPTSRRRILVKCIDEGELTIAQIKSHLDWLIKFHGSKANMMWSVKDWQSDIEYLNALVLNRRKR